MSHGGKCAGSTILVELLKRGLHCPSREPKACWTPSDERPAVDQRQQSQHLLLVEDDTDTAVLLKEFLEPLGYVVDHAGDGFEGLRLAGSLHYDLIVLDGKIPGMDGIDLCRSIRNNLRKSAPILFLWGRDQVEDRIAGLDAGADDYLGKPFALQELQARLSGLLTRQRRRVVPSKLTIGDLLVDVEQHMAQRSGQVLALSPIQFQLLVVLAKASPEIVTRSDFEKAIWSGGKPDTDSLRSHLCIVRKAIDKPFDQPLLHTIVGEGYRLASIEASVPA